MDYLVVRCALHPLCTLAPLFFLPIPPPLPGSGEVVRLPCQACHPYHSPFHTPSLPSSPHQALARLCAPQADGGNGGGPGGLPRLSELSLPQQQRGGGGGGGGGPAMQVGVGLPYLVYTPLCCDVVCHPVFLFTSCGRWYTQCLRRTCFVPPSPPTAACNHIVPHLSSLLPAAALPNPIALVHLPNDLILIHTFLPSFLVAAAPRGCRWWWWRRCQQECGHFLPPPQPPPSTLGTPGCRHPLPAAASAGAAAAGEWERSDCSYLGLILFPCCQQQHDVCLAEQPKHNPNPKPSPPPLSLMSLHPQGGASMSALLNSLPSSMLQVRVCVCGGVRLLSGAAIIASATSSWLCAADITCLRPSRPPPPPLPPYSPLLASLVHPPHTLPMLQEILAASAVAGAGGLAGIQV